MSSSLPLPPIPLLSLFLVFERGRAPAEVHHGHADLVHPDGDAGSCEPAGARKRRSATAKASPGAGRLALGSAGRLRCPGLAAEACPLVCSMLVLCLELSVADDEVKGAGFSGCAVLAAAGTTRGVGSLEACLVRDGRLGWPYAGGWRPAGGVR
jgi:hypothetical protein